MTTRSVKLFFLSLAAVCVASAHLAVAQQVTYYTFDNAPGNYSYSCVDPNNNPYEGSLPNPPLCLNDYNYGSNPSFLSVPYPPNLGSGNHYEMLMNEATPGDSEDAWFSVPQPITSGFTSYFAFRLTPAPVGSGAGRSQYTADGIAFVIQNALGTGQVDPYTNCVEGQIGEDFYSSGPNVVAGEQYSYGCLGYSGIDNSLAVEFDTFNDTWDPNGGNSPSNADHISLQSCGSGVNSASHLPGSGCQVFDDNDSESAALAPDNSFGITLADGNVHEAVVEYTGSQGTPAYQLQVFIDPPFVSGTHTPCPSDYYDYSGCGQAATPVISTTYNIGNHLGLLGTNLDSAYVGFTSSTADSYFEQQELLAWTFTPHSATTQTQTLQPPGPPGTYPTTFPFGNHTFGVNFESGSYGANTYDMVVTAITISPTLFEQLVTGTSFAGSECQIYDGTGGNCVVYSVSCLDHGTSTVVPCPPTDDPSQPLIDVKSSYDNSLEPNSVGMFQGDPFLAPIASISDDGTNATVTCAGECAVHNGQVVNILGNSHNGYNVTGVTASNSTINSFTFPSTDTTGGTGGYVNSNNLTSLPDYSYSPQRIDGTSTDKTKNFSELVVLSANPTVQVTVNTNPAGRSFSVDNSPYSTSQTFAWHVGDIHTISTTSPQPGATGTQYVWTGWSDSQAIEHQVTASIATTYTAYFGTQYYLTTGVSPAGAGSVTPSGFYNAGSPAPLSATANPGYAFSNWSSTTGTITNPSSATGASIVMSAPENATANFTASATSAISVTPGSLAFGDVDLGTSKSLPLTVKNVSSTSLTITKISFNYGHTGSGSNYGYTTQCGGALKPGKTCTITVTLKAQDLGPGTATLNIAYNQPGSPAVVNLSGNVINPKAKLSVGSLSFGTIKLGQNSIKTVTLSSIGDTPLNISSIAITGSTDFTLSPMNPCPASMPKNTSCTIGVKFAPSAKQSRTGTLKITDNASSSPQTVSLSGKGN
jgi:Divergent InlB B-repeat domain/Cep192 domain 4/Abnormal spindle-like microcephaly-assoc'd, ASPM-SPD-2-Hydin/Legume lectin domain